MRFAVWVALWLTLWLALAACRPTPGKPALPPTLGQPPAGGAEKPAVASVTPLPATAATAATPSLIQASAPSRAPTLADLWAGNAQFAVDVADTGLPMGI